MTKQKKVVILLLLLAFICACFAMVSTATEPPTVKDLFEYTNVTAENEKTDGKTDNKGLLLTATQSGAAAKLVAEQTGVFDINLKPLTQGGQITLDNYSVKITDTETGESFKIGVLDKSDYANVFVQVANGNRGGLYYPYSDSNGFVPGYTAAYSDMSKKYTMFYKNTAVTEDEAGFSDSVKLRFDPATMKVSMIRCYELDKAIYADVWDLSEEINDGYDIGYSYSSFASYTVEIVFESVLNKAQMLVYSAAGVDFSAKEVSDTKAAINADVKTKAVLNKLYKIPDAKASDLFGKVDGEILVSAKIGDTALNVRDDGCVRPTAVGEMEITYTLSSNSAVTKTYKIDVISSAQNEVEDPSGVPSSVGVNAVIEIPKTKINSNLYLKANNEFAKVSVLLNGAIYKNFENVDSGFEFVAETEGEYEIKYISPVSSDITKSERFTVTASEASLVADKLARVYVLGSSVVISPAKVYLNGTSFDSAVYVILPSGNTAESGEITLTEVGKYKVVHSYSASDTEYQFVQEFSVEQTVDSMFEADDKTEISFGNMSGNNTYYGVKLSLTENKPVAYSQIIDISDNTKDDILVELMAQPKTIGTNDITVLYIDFTDVLDPENVMSVRLVYTNYTTTVSYVTAMGGDKQWYTGESSKHGIQSIAGGLAYGFLARHSFTQTVRYPFDTYTLKLRYDYEENALYANPEYDYESHLVCDFDNEAYFGSTLWSGFKSGQVKMSIYGTGITSTGDIYVMNIDGTKFDKELYTDTTAPVIEPVFTPSTVPVAEVNRPYKVVDYNTYDAYSDIKSTSYKVFFNGEEVTVSDGYFTPLSAGVYSIVYEATDYFGNNAEYTINVNALARVTAPNITVNGTVATDVSFGQTVTLPSYTLSNGAGGLKGGITVTFDGEPVTVSANRFTAGEVGTYIVRYSVEDYIGNSRYITYFINCNFSDIPILDESLITLPPAFINGESYTFDEYEAVFYMSETSKNYIPAVIEITDAKGTYTLDGREYTPVASSDENTVDSITVKFIFEQQGVAPLVITREIPAVTLAKETGALAKYFVTENAEAVANKDGIIFSASANGKLKLTFARALNTKDLKFIFNVLGENAETIFKNFASFNVILSDTRNGGQKVSVNYVKTGDALTVTIGERTVSSSVNRQGEFLFAYDKDTNTVSDVNSITLGEITHTVDGSEFDGFDSGEVYLSIEVLDIFGDCGFVFKSIDNQGFNYVPTDRVDPVLWVNGSISGSYDIGAEIIIPTAGAYDVLSPISPVTVTVTAPNGEKILSKADASKESKLTMGQYGVYYVRYETTDASGRTKVVTMSAIVRDIASSEILFNSPLPDTVRAGTQIKLNDYTVKDNKDISEVTVQVSVFRPDGTYSVVTDETIKLTDTGFYIFTYMALDGDNNITTYTFSVRVIK